MYSIEKGVPLPEANVGRRSSNNAMSFVAEMEVQDSFFVVVPKDKKSDSVRSGVLTSIQSFKKRTGLAHKFATRSVVEERDGESVSGVRVWRVA